MELCGKCSKDAASKLNQKEISQISSSLMVVKDNSPQLLRFSIILKLSPLI